LTPVPSQLLTAMKDALRITFVTPVREGRPHPSAWPHGLREIGTAATAVFTLLALATVFAGPLRQSGQLAMSGASPNGVPTLTLPLLLTGVLLSAALAMTAALHSPWWLRLVLLTVGGSAVFFFLPGFLNDPLKLGISVLACLALVVFAFVRSFRSYVWWEFPVVAGLLMMAVFWPWLLPGVSAQLGLDTRPTALEGALLTLQPLVLPAMMVAGSAPAQIVVTGAQATADRPVGPGIFWTGFGIAVAWLSVTTALAAGGPELNPSALLASAVLLAVVGGGVAILLRRARVGIPPSPGAYPPVWGRWLYPLAAAVAAVPALLLPLAILRGILQLTGQGEALGVLNTVWFAFLDNNPQFLWRWALAPVAFVIAWRLVRRERLAEAVAVATFSILLASDAVGAVPGLGFLQDRTTLAFGVLAAAIALVAAAVMAARRRFVRSRAVGVMTVVLLAVLYPHRNLIENPTSVFAVLSPAVLLVFGLAWRSATEAGFTYGSTPKYPQSTRVLLFLANTLLAGTGLAYLALARAAGTRVDPAGWGALGDTVLGDPLYVTGLVTGLWFVLHPAAREPVPTATTAPQAADTPFGGSPPT